MGASYSCFGRPQQSAHMGRDQAFGNYCGDSEDETKRDSRYGFFPSFIHVANMKVALLAGNPLVQQLCDEFGATSLAGIHPSLTNKNKIKVLLDYNRAIQHPGGDNPIAVMSMYHREMGSSGAVSYISSPPQNM